MKLDANALMDDLHVVAARMIGRDHINIETSEHRCPGDCPGGRAIYRTGLHEAIDKALASGEWTESATPERASELLFSH